MLEKRVKNIRRKKSRMYSVLSVFIMKEESEKFGLKLNIQKTKIMASGPIISWQVDGETVETVAEFVFWAPKSLQNSLEGKL